MTYNEIILSEYERLRVESNGDIIEVYIDDMMERNDGEVILSNDYIRIMPEDFDVFCKGINKINELLKLESENLESNDVRMNIQE